MICDSVISRITLPHVMPAASVQLTRCSVSPGARSSAADRLTLTTMSGSSKPRRSAGRSAQARASMRRPSGTIIPLCSASGMNTSGTTGPRSGCVQRASASTPRTRPVVMSTTGW